MVPAARGLVASSSVATMARAVGGACRLRTRRALRGVAPEGRHRLFKPDHRPDRPPTGRTGVKRHQELTGEFVVSPDNVTTAAGLRASAKALEQPPAPKVGAPVLDPTDERDVETEPWSGS